MHILSDAASDPRHPADCGTSGGRDLISSRDGAIRKRRAGAEDVEIGRKIRALRLERGLSQSNLADGIGLTFQQVQKYEKGMNRVSAGRLQRIADMLNIPVTFFYGGMGSRAKKRESRRSGFRLHADPGRGAADARLCGDFLAQHEVCAGRAGGVAEG